MLPTCKLFVVCIHVISWSSSTLMATETSILRFWGIVFANLGVSASLKTGSTISTKCAYNTHLTEVGTPLDKGWETKYWWSYCQHQPYWIYWYWLVCMSSSLNWCCSNSLNMFSFFGHASPFRMIILDTNSGCSVIQECTFTGKMAWHRLRWIRSLMK